MKLKCFLTPVFALLISFSSGAIAAELSGVWSSIDGEISLDLDEKYYYGIDDGCKIDDIKSSEKDAYAIR